MAFRNITDVEEAATYVASLDERWPQRAAIKAHLSSQLRATAGTHVVELCAGAGALAEKLMSDHPQISYTGIDITVPLLTLARTRLAIYDGQVTWIEADLNQSEWLGQIARPVHAFVSLQSIHDLGDESAVARIIGLVARNLAPNGQFIYADMLAAELPEGNPNPGKLTVQRHLELLEATGFATAACTWSVGVFGCFYAQVI